MSTVGSGPSMANAMAVGPLVLDGGLATELERRGHDLSGALWSARLLRDDPEALVGVHAAYFEAGAQVATTASYQASISGFAAAGLDPAQARRLLHRSVDLAREAQQRRRAAASTPTWVAASVGPYGAVLADGSEYRGDYGLTVEQLRAFHRPRLEALAGAGPDVLACETVPCLAEAEALLAELAKLEFPAWLSLTVDGGRTRAGEPAAQAYAMARDVDAVLAVGVNCCRPRRLDAVVAEASARSGKPVVVYPNSGEEWDARTRRWTGGRTGGGTGGRTGGGTGGAATFAADVAAWVGAGARLVGGCCRVGPAEISAVAAALRATPA